jgi:hypothetical protein
MTRKPNRSKRDLERLLDELRERKAARDDGLDLDDVPDELVEEVIQVSHKRLDGEDLDEDDARLSRFLDDFAPVE